MSVVQESFQIIEELSASNLSGAALRLQAVTRLSELSGYDWSGIYRLEGGVLVLDTFVGEPTDHTTIPVGKGVCGTAVAEGANQIVANVCALDNYLSCSINTKSEIVVLIRNEEGRILGQIDVDSHRAGAFDSSDEALLEGMAAVLAGRW